jgi:indole-3-acetate monooxygenase
MGNLFAAANCGHGGEKSVSETATSSFIDAAKEFAGQIRELAADIEQSSCLPLPLVESMARAGLFRLWIPRALGGEETDPMTFVRVVEEISRADGATGWCVALGGEYGVFGGYLPREIAHEIYGSDPCVRTAGQLRASGEARVVDGGYRVAGRWPLGSGCQHSHWIVGGCRILDGAEPRLSADGTPVSRILFFPVADCEILDTWHSIGLRGTGSHDYAVGGMLRMRCSWRARGRRVALVTGPVLSTRVRPAACAIIAVCDQYQTPPHPGLMT